MKNLELTQMEEVNGGGWGLAGFACGGSAAILVAVAVGSAGTMAPAAFWALAGICGAELSVLL